MRSPSPGSPARNPCITCFLTWRVAWCATLPHRSTQPAGRLRQVASGTCVLRVRNSHITDPGDPRNERVIVKDHEQKRRPRAFCYSIAKRPRDRRAVQVHETRSGSSPLRSRSASARPCPSCGAPAGLRYRHAGAFLQGLRLLGRASALPPPPDAIGVVLDLALPEGEALVRGDVNAGVGGRPRTPSSSGVATQVADQLYAVPHLCFHVVRFFGGANMEARRRRSGRSAFIVVHKRLLDVTPVPNSTGFIFAALPTPPRIHEPAWSAFSFRPTSPKWPIAPPTTRRKWPSAWTPTQTLLHIVAEADDAEEARTKLAMECERAHGLYPNTRLCRWCGWAPSMRTSARWPRRNGAGRSSWHARHARHAVHHRQPQARAITNSSLPFIVVQERNIKPAGYRDIVVPFDLHKENPPETGPWWATWLSTSGWRCACWCPARRTSSCKPAAEPPEVRERLPAKGGIEHESHPDGRTATTS